MHKVFNRGFTLIELLVVIAIIGILAGIVLASLGSVRQRGAVAGIGANLAGMRTAAELFSQANAQSYDGYCASTATNGGRRALDAAKSAAGVTAATSIDAASGVNTVTCNDGAAGWAAEISLGSLVTPSGQFWCVDFNGFSGTTSAANFAAATDYTCN
ncbi:MAG TPA: prepilin-type N-terminal cleavage/methylation domain-containing protein [Candidatus Paceibacterota bacterium]|nr:prepilin-type N-terminal cleavage/methylation domain-containing protein [Candidatus Paceibacterota bacterium]